MSRFKLAFTRLIIDIDTGSLVNEIFKSLNLLKSWLVQIRF